MVRSVPRVARRRPASALAALELRSERLLLRPPVAADAAAIAAGIAYWDVVRMLAVVPWPYTLGDAELYVAAAANEVAAGTDLHAVILDESGLVGCISIAEVSEPGHFGYWLTPRAWGRGYATEAGRALLGFAFDKLGLTTVPSGYFSGNAGSARVQEKLGFEVTGWSRMFCLARGGDADHIDTVVTAARFRAGNP